MQTEAITYENRLLDGRISLSLVLGLMVGLGISVTGLTPVQAGQISACSDGAPLITADGDINAQDFNLHCDLEINGTFTNQSAGKIENFRSHRTIYLDAGDTFDNQGTLRSHVLIRNEGTVNLGADSVLDISPDEDRGAILNSGTVNIHNDVEARISRSSTRNHVFNFSGGITNVYGSYDLENTNSSNLQIYGVYNVQSGGAVNVSTGRVKANSASINNAGRLSTDAGGTLIVGGSNTLRTATLENSGTIDNKGALIVDDLGTLSNAGGTINSSGSITVYNARDSNTDALFNNQGGTFNNTGALTVEAVNTLSNGQEIMFDNSAGVFNNEGMATIGPDSRFLNANGTIDNSGVLTVGSGAEFSGTGGTILNRGTLTTESGANVNVGPSLISNAGTLTFGGGAIVDVTGSDVNNTGTLTFGADSVVNSDAVTEYINSGTLIVEANSLNNSISGNIHNEAGGRFILNRNFRANLSNDLVLESGGTFESSAVLTIDRAEVFNQGELINRGTLVLDRDRRQDTLFENNGRLVNAIGGLVDIEEGSQFLNKGTLVNNGVFRTEDFVELTGDVSGSGSFEGDIVMNGNFRPGNSPGLVTADSLVFDVSSTLFIEIGGENRGAEYDAIDAFNVTLGGMLDVALIDLTNGFSPMGGETFDLIIADQINGSFSSFAFAALADGLSWATNIFTNQFGQDVFQLTIQGQLILPETGVPVPGAVYLFGFGLLGIAVGRRRRAARA